MAWFLRNSAGYLHEVDHFWSINMDFVHYDPNPLYPRCILQGLWAAEIYLCKRDGAVRGFGFTLS